ncbi:MAG: hypothetical protein HY078_14165 [Elusimicrobia bacterium]|nr:hypothetical protein [Elusimicrobiota bacterium]
MILASKILLTLFLLMRAAFGQSPAKHLFYVFGDKGGGLFVFDIDAGHKLIKELPLPTRDAVLGAAVDPAAGMLFLAYGARGEAKNEPSGFGSLLKYDLSKDRVVWNREYHHGVDSMAITPDGKTIYLPIGAESADDVWYIIDTSSGDEKGRIHAAEDPHNTIVSQDGQQVFMGGTTDSFLYVADTSTNKVTRRIGPLNTGVRPFAINRDASIVYTIGTKYFGFQTSDAVSGKVLYTTPISGFSWEPVHPRKRHLPNHGMSLSPDDKEIWITDKTNAHVHVFDVSKVPASPPVQVASVRLTRPFEKNGWLQLSRDGRFAYVGDQGDVIDTKTRKVVTNLPALRKTKAFLQIDFKDGKCVAATSRHSPGFFSANK